VSVVNHYHINGGNPGELQRVVEQENRKLITALRAGRR